MVKKNFTVIFDIFEFDETLIYKDPAMIPFYMKKMFGIDPRIVFFDNEKNRSLSAELNGVRMVRIKSAPAKIPLLKKLRHLKIFSYIIKNAGKIDILNLYHFSPYTILNALLYKRLNPAGFVYVKLDDDLINLKKKGEFWDTNNILYRFIYKKYGPDFFKKVGLFSIETREGEALINKYYRSIRDKTIYLPNGFDNMIFKKDIPKLKTFALKENLIITVGRIGSVQKNSVMLMEALKKIDLKNWKAAFIGPVEEKFREKITDFYRGRPDLKEKVIFTGNINDRKGLYQWYNRAKVFCMTSLWESFGIVLVEALYFGDYIISTNVGSAEDAVNKGELGSIIKTGDLKALCRELEAIISGRKKIARYYKGIIENSRKNFLWESSIEKLHSEIEKRMK